MVLVVPTDLNSAVGPKEATPICSNCMNERYSMEATEPRRYDAAMIVIMGSKFATTAQLH